MEAEDVDDDDDGTSSFLAIPQLVVFAPRHVHIRPSAKVKSHSNDTKIKANDPPLAQSEI